MDKNVVQQNSHRWFFEAVAKAPRRLLLVEYEAALAPLWNSHAPYPGISDRLERVLNDRRTRLVVITSGLAKDVRHVLGMQVAPEIWGCDGLERLCGDGHYECGKLDIPTEAMEALAESEIWLRRNGLGMFLEVRLAGISVHWRGLSDIDDLLEVRKKAYQVFRPLALRHPSLRFHAFEGGVELRLNGATVGNALRDLLSSITSETPVAYIGDDRVDSEPFEVLNDRDFTVVIRVLPRSEADRAHRRPPQEFMRFIDDWIQTTQTSLG
jgi:trehalose 6-phosphate synthase/trehalose 6-phosphate phosphatase